MSIVLRVILSGTLQNAKDSKEFKKPQQIKLKTSLNVRDAIDEIIKSLKLKITADQVIKYFYQYLFLVRFIASCNFQRYSSYLA